MKPFAIEMNFTVDAVDLEAAVEIHDDVLEFAERHGFNFEGGSVGPVPDEQVSAVTS